MYQERDFVNNEIPIRFIKEIGTRAFLRIYWHDEKDKDCPFGYHNAMKAIIDSRVINDWELGGNDTSRYPREMWSTHCRDCGQPVPASNSGIEVHYQIHRERLYDTLSGHPELGDMYFAPYYHGEDKKFHCRNWDNCNDPRGHLMVRLPGGWDWDLDSRANNCTKPEDKIHRCWVRHGDPEHPETMHVDKNGNTCAAGAGSIVSGSKMFPFHGFLHNGKLIKC